MRHSEAVVDVARAELPEVDVVLHLPTAVRPQSLVNNVPGLNPAVEMAHRRTDMPVEKA